MKQSHLIGFTAVLVALVSGPRPAAAQISEARIKELVREAAKTAEQTPGPSPVQVPGEGPAVSMTLDDAVNFALERNLDIAVQRLNPQLQDIAVASARTFYRPTLTSSLGQNHNVQRTDQPAAVVAGRRRRHEPDAHLQRRHHAELHLAAAAPSAATLNNSRQATQPQQRLLQPAVQPRSGASNYTQPLLRDFRIDTQRRQLHRLAGEPRHLGRAAARVDHEHRLERAQRVLGLRVHDAGGRGGAPIARAGDQARAGQPDLASRSARWRRSTSSRRRPSRRRAARGWSTAENAKRTAELALKRLIVSGTDDPNWAATLDPVDRPDFQSRTDRHRSGDPARAQPAHGSRDRQEERREQRRPRSATCATRRCRRRPAGELRRAGRRRTVSAALEQRRARQPDHRRSIPGGLARRAPLALREPLSALDGRSST